MKKMMAYGAVLVAAGAASMVAGAAPTLDDLVKELGFSNGDAARLRNGEIINRDLASHAEKELGIAVAMLVPTPLHEVAEAIRSGDALRVNPSLRSFVEIPAGGSAEAEQAFEAVTFSPKEMAEAAKFLRAKAGSEVNLSPDELARFQALGKKYKSKNLAKNRAAQAAVTDEVRRLLHGRYTSYLAGGMSGVDPYDRGGKKRSDPGKELRALLKSAKIIAKHAPDFHEAFANYPRGGADDIENRFYVFKQEVDDRPTFILAHWMLQERPDYVLLGERRFYVEHSYNAQQTLIGCFPMSDGGTAVFYAYRTSTDQVTGFGSGVKKSIGRDRMRAGVIEYFESIKKAAK
jgi:sulfur carrier protein ThiS